ncbi:MAG: zinc metallopeptidase [Granulosicoccaceae bacterium]|jgi:hypothetical protein
MIVALGTVLLVVLIFAPQWWAQRTLSRHAAERKYLPGTGGELAQHLLEQLDLHGVTLETTEHGDHYDPRSRCVRLGKSHMQGRSLSAVAVAAHEVGHALQHASHYSPLVLRTRLVAWTQRFERAGALFMLLVPVVMLLTRTPVSGLAMLAAGLCLLGLPVLVHLVTLPVEWDASFARALPVLKAGAYLDEQDLRVVQQILLACALTYFAASLASLLNLGRWWMLLRR